MKVSALLLTGIIIFAVGGIILHEKMPGREHETLPESCTLKIPQTPPEHEGEKLLGHSIHYSISARYVMPGGKVSAAIRDNTGLNYSFVLAVYANESGWKLIDTAYGRNPRLNLPNQAGRPYVLVLYAVDPASCEPVDFAVSGVYTTGTHFSAEMKLNKKRYRVGEKAELIITNTGDVPFTTGYPYRLYRWENGEWKKVKTGIVFIMIGIEVPPGQNWSQKISLVKEKENPPSEAIGDPANLEPLPPGRYRIVKEVYPFVSGLKEKLTLEAEFEVVNG